MTANEPVRTAADEVAAAEQELKAAQEKLEAARAKLAAEEGERVAEEPSDADEPAGSGESAGSGEFANSDQPANSDEPAGAEAKVPPAVESAFVNAVEPEAKQQPTFANPAPPQGSPVCPPYAPPAFGGPSSAPAPQPSYGQQPGYAPPHAGPGAVPPQQPYYGYQPPCYQQPYTPPVVAAKDHVAAGLLAIFLGWLGIHKFYLGYNTPGFVMLGVSILGGIVTFGLASFVIWVIAIVEGVIYLTKSQSEFEQIYVMQSRDWF
ncbi:NINE protein [Rubneribacter sp.]|nr:NINE protein [Candidatus Rubneribacter avistercoris]